MIYFAREFPTAGGLVDRVKRFERIPLGTDRLKTFVEIEKARLPHDVPPRCP